MKVVIPHLNKNKFYKNIYNIVNSSPSNAAMRYNCRGLWAHFKTTIQREKKNENLQKVENVHSGYAAIRILRNHKEVSNRKMNLTRFACK